MRVQDKDRQAEMLDERVTKRKEQLKENIAIKLSALSGSLQAHADEQGDVDMLNTVKITKSDIMKLKETDMDGKVKKLVSVAQGLLNVLADFGVS